MRLTSLLRRLGYRPALLALAVLLSLAAATHAAPDPQQAQKHRAAAEPLRKTADGIEAKAAKVPAPMKEAAKAWADATRSQAAASEKLADAYDSGDPAALQAATAEYVKASDAAQRGGERTTALENALGLRSETPLAGWQKETPPAAAKELEAMLAARRLAADAWQKVSDLANSDAAWPRIEEAKDAAAQASNDLILAQRLRSNASEYARRAAAVQRSGEPAAKEKLAAIKRLDEEMINALRQQLDATLKLRKLDRQRDQLARELEVHKPEKPATAKSEK